MIKLISGEVIFLDHGESFERSSRPYTVIKDFDIMQARDSFLELLKAQGRDTEQAQFAFKEWLIEQGFVEEKIYNHIDLGYGKELCIYYS